ILKRFTLTLDYGHQLLWLQPNKANDVPEGFARPGVGIARPKDGTIAIADVTEGGAAAGAGLVAGDSLLAVDGVPSSKLKLYELRERFKQAPGTKLSLT